MSSPGVFSLSTAGLILLGAIAAAVFAAEVAFGGLGRRVGSAVSGAASSAFAARPKGSVLVPSAESGRGGTSWQADEILLDTSESGGVDSGLQGPPARPVD